MNYSSPDQLTEYVGKIATHTELWKPYVEPGKKRFYKRLVDNPTLNCWLICWNEGHDTGLHDHDGSAGGVIVIEGCVSESRLFETQPEYGIFEKEQLYQVGQTFQFGPYDIHRVKHTGILPAVTIHAYSPPLKHMGSYGFVNNEFKRMPMQDEEELRPLEKVLQDGNGSN